MTGTFDLEDGLPRVPVPPLGDSVALLLEWCAPLVAPADLEATRSALDELVKGPGPDLQAALVAYDGDPGTHSWLDDFWETRYLGRRDRIALNANFCFLFDDPRPSPPGQLERAAELIHAALHHKQLVDTGMLPPAMRRGEPISMVQHKYLFSATRIPGERQDTARTPYTDAAPGPSPERHIVVFAHGRMASLEVFGANGVAHPVAELIDALASIQALDPAPPGTSPGHLTTMDRAPWARARAELLEADPENARSLDVLERALFCVVLEEATPDSDEATTAQLLHGNSANRWFDKALSLIVFPDGKAGSNTEHCRLDGTTVLALLDTMLGASPEAHAEALGARSQGTPAVAPVDFVLTEDLGRRIIDAGADFATFAASQAIRLLVFEDVGANAAKALGVSPDALVQLAYQLAHRRSRGTTGATYESIATTQFHHGRTEAMRVVTPEIVAFVDAVEDPAAGDDVRREAARAAATAHARRAADCRAGTAPEQHLWALAMRQAEGDGEPLAFTGSPGWRILRNDNLSTSSAPSEHVRAFAFGSTGRDCIGVAYVLLPDRLLVHLSALREAETIGGFAEELINSLAELPALLAG